MAGIAELEALAADVGSLFGLSGIVEDTKDLAVLGASAAAGIAASQLLFKNITALGTLPDWQKALVKIALGVGGGIALGKVHKGVAAGVGAALVGEGLVTLAAPYLGQIPVIGSYFTGLSAGDSVLLGMGSTAIYDRNSVPGGVGSLGVMARDMPPALGNFASIDDDVGAFLS